MDLKIYIIIILFIYLTEAKLPRCYNGCIREKTTCKKMPTKLPRCYDGYIREKFTCERNPDRTVKCYSHGNCINKDGYIFNPPKGFRECF